MPLILNGQTAGYKISGQIFDSQGQPLPGATVRILNTTNGTVSGARGEYTLEVKRQDIFTVEISSIGFEKIIKTVEVKSLKTELSFQLEEKISELNEVVIEAKSEGQQLALSAKSVQVIETMRAKLKSADMGMIMTRTEGVNVQRSGGLGSGVRFSLNGLSGEQIRFFHNDIPLDFTPYSSGFADIPVNLIDRVEIYKGVVPLKFGADALGGAVNLVSPGPDSHRDDGFGGTVSFQYGSFNTHRASGYINYANKQTGLFVAAGGFYDYTDNNYEIDAIIANERGQPQQETVERFNDAYQAYGGNVKLGIRNKTWAKELSLEAYYGDTDNEIQNSLQPGLVDEPALGINEAVAGPPLGDLRFTIFSEGLNLRYKAGDSEKAASWNYDLTAGYNYNERISIDTSRNLYNWRGEVVRVKNIPGEFGSAEHLVTKSESVFARQLIGYNFSDDHSVQFVIAPTYTFRTADDLLISGDFDPALDDGYLLNFVSGLEHNSVWLDERLQNIAFVKYYHQGLRLESLDQSLQTTRTDERTENNYGAGNALKYDWSDRLFTKLSYEYAFRLPNQFEIFGDGLLIQQNLELRPESSHNVNFLWNLKNKTGNSNDWQLQVNFFLRSIRDLIRPFPIIAQGAGDAILSQNQNIFSSTSQGFELTGTWKNLIKGLTLDANTTYQRFFNTSDSGPFTRNKGDRIPLEPYFFANGKAEYELKNIIRQNDNLSFFWNTRFVHSFFIGWEGDGANFQQFKDQVPNQTIHAAGITYRMNIKKLQNAITLEVQNLTNEKVFDFFGVQRPGRAFYIKSTIQF